MVEDLSKHVFPLQVLSSLRSVSLDQSYKKVENLTEKFKDLKQRFGLSSTQRLVHVAHLEMEQVRCATYGIAVALRRS